MRWVDDVNEEILMARKLTLRQRLTALGGGWGWGVGGALTSGARLLSSGFAPAATRSLTISALNLLASAA